MSDINATVFPTMTGRGLTKRELLAAMAMQGLVTETGTCGDRGVIEVIAERSVRMADALLAELAKDAP